MAYTSGDILVRAVMEAASGLPQDQVVNQFTFQKATAASGSDLITCMDLVSDFYRDAQTNTHSVGEYISSQINRSATHELQAWVITTPPMGSPDQAQAWLGPPTVGDGGGLPTEVSAVLSFHADLTNDLEESGSTRPRARRRGRVYIGPLTPQAIAGTTPPYYLHSTFTETLRQAAITLFDAAETAGIPWAVWSRVDSTLRPVVAGWTDNAPDTQRRRGPDSNVRVAWIP